MSMKVASYEAGERIKYLGFFAKNKLIKYLVVHVDEGCECIEYLGFLKTN